MEVQNSAQLSDPSPLVSIVCGDPQRRGAGISSCLLAAPTQHRRHRSGASLRAGGREALQMTGAGGVPRTPEPVLRRASASTS